MMTFAELLGHWMERDSRYSLRRWNGTRIPLTDDEISSIQAYRRREVSELPERDRKLGGVTLERWIPPVVRR